MVLIELRDEGSVGIHDNIVDVMYRSDQNKVYFYFKGDKGEEEVVDVLSNMSIRVGETLAQAKHDPIFEWLSDAEQKRRAEAKAEEAKIRDKECCDVLIPVKPRYMDPLSELEYHIRWWCMANGYADDTDQWFEVCIETEYKKKVCSVQILSTLEPKKSVFEGQTTTEMFSKAIKFYTGGCAV